MHREHSSSHLRLSLRHPNIARSDGPRHRKDLACLCVSVGSSGYIRLYYACLPCLALTTWTQPRQTRTSRSCAVVPPLRHEKSNDRMPPAPCTETSCTPGQTCLCATCLCARCGSIIERLYPLKYTESSPAPRRVEARPAAPSSPLLNSCS